MTDRTAPDRTVLAVHPALRDDIADLVTRRPLPGPRLPSLNPFLFLNHHGPQTYPPGNRGLPFGPHPHRGFETVTFIVDGSLAHADTAGHQSVIEAGGVQWMTAGSGIVHAELSPPAFQRQGGPLEILQLWLNLPAALKMTAPRYVGLQREAIPQLPAAQGQATVSLAAGRWQGHAGAFTPITDVFMSTVQAADGAELAFDGTQGREVFFYVVRGAVQVGAQRVQAHELAQFADDGDRIAWRSQGDSLVLFGHAPPLHEPLASYGPFVMNTREEIQQAIADYQAGRFGDAPM